MPNPIATAIKGKGTRAVLRRVRSLASRYGLGTNKMDGALTQLVDILQQFGDQATLPVTAVVLARNSALVQKYHARGIEFAVHGLVHVDHSQLSLHDQQAQFSRAQQLFNAAGIAPAGFRCPYLRWNADTLSALAGCGFVYDSSQALAWDVTDGLETEVYRHALKFYGARSAREYPSLPKLESGIVRFPYALPDDEALVERLGLTSGDAMVRMWLDILERTYCDGEVFVVGLHPERAAPCAEALRATLERAHSMTPSVWVARLDEMADWWRVRAATTFTVAESRLAAGRLAHSRLAAGRLAHSGPADGTWEADGLCSVEVNAPPEAVVLARAVEVRAPHTPWTRGYQRVSMHAFSFRADKRPFIGLAPGSSPALHDFLRQQGYLVEVNTDAQAYPLYLDRPSFESEEERTLLAQIEGGTWPLLRVSRWPGGAKSALAITGDIDAFTLWDYGLRALSR